MVRAPAILCLSLLLSACSGTKSVVRPGWFSTPPKSMRNLYFVGDATGAIDVSNAKELAVAKAMSELTVYCGATVKAEFQSLEREVNGKYEQVVSQTVDVAGEELTIREAVVKEVVAGEASDGSFTGYALIEWPKARYQEVLRAQRARAQRALALHLEADAAFGQMQLSLAQSKLGEAKQIMGAYRTQIPLDHPKISNSFLLQNAMNALEARILSAVEQRSRLIAVEVGCQEKGVKVQCPSHRTGTIQQTLAQQGFKLSTDAMPSGLAQQILASSSPQVDAQMRNAKYILAVNYSARFTGEDSGFTFAHCGAKAALFDTEQKRMVSVKEVKPIKGGHISFAGAVKKGCGSAEKDLLSWLQQTLASF